MIDQRIFENLQAKIDEESTVRDVSHTKARPDFGEFFARQAYTGTRPLS